MGCNSRITSYNVCYTKLLRIYDPYYPDMFFNDAQNDELILRRLDGGKDGQSNGMASRNFPPRTLLAGNVITSYSIHYTKLYE